MSITTSINTINLYDPNDYNSDYALGPLLSIFEYSKTFLDVPKSSIDEKIEPIAKSDSDLKLFWQFRQNIPYEIDALYIDIDFPEITSDNNTDKICVNPNILTIIHHIEMLIVNVETKQPEIKLLSSNEYELLLQLTGKWEQFCKEQEWIPSNGEYTTKIAAQKIKLPLYFQHTLKPFMLQTPLNISIHFNPIDKLISATPLYPLVPFCVTSANVIARFLIVNDAMYFKLLFAEPLYELEKGLCVKTLPITNTSIKIDDLSERYSHALIFSFQNSIYSCNQTFFGATVETSIKNFIGSCIKVNNTNESAQSFSLQTLLFKNDLPRVEIRPGHTITLDKLSDTEILLTSVIGKNAYKTQINLSLSHKNLTNVWFDLTISKHIHIHYFKSIDLSISLCDTNTDVISDKKFVDIRAKVLNNGLFVHSQNGVSLSYWGCCAFTLHTCIYIEKNNQTSHKKEDVFISRQYFDILFSQPVKDCFASYYAQHNFVCLNKPNYAFLDLDKKWPILINYVTLINKEDSNIQKKYGQNDLILNKDVNSLYCGAQTLSFSQKNKKGFFFLGNSNLSISLDEPHLLSNFIIDRKIEMTVTCVHTNFYRYAHKNYEKLTKEKLLELGSSKFVTDALSVARLL